MWLSMLLVLIRILLGWLWDGWFIIDILSLLLFTLLLFLPFLFIIYPIILLVVLFFRAFLHSSVCLSLIEYFHHLGHTTQSVPHIVISHIPNHSFPTSLLSYYAHFPSHAQRISKLHLSYAHYYVPLSAYQQLHSHWFRMNLDGYWLIEGGTSRVPYSLRLTQQFIILN